MNYEVTLKIKNKTPGGLFEFKWGSNTLRAKFETTALLIDAEDDEALLDLVLDLSKDTLEIIKFEQVSKYEKKAVDLFAELAIPKTNIQVLENINMAMSNN